jgi:hypothetical protein
LILPSFVLFSWCFSSKTNNHKTIQFRAACERFY